METSLVGLQLESLPSWPNRPHALVSLKFVDRSLLTEITNAVSQRRDRVRLEFIIN